MVRSGQSGAEGKGRGRSLIETLRGRRIEFVGVENDERAVWLSLLLDTGDEVQFANPVIVVVHNDDGHNGD